MVSFAALWFSTIGSGNSDCPVPADRQPYVTEIVQKLAFDLVFVGSNVHDRDRGFALSFFGVDTGYLGQLLLVQECTERHVFDPFFETILDPRMIVRSQIICEGPGVDVIKVEAASNPEAKDGDFRTLTYSATHFPGTVRYEPFPVVEWRAIKTGGNDFTVGAAIFRRLIFVPTGADRVDLTHIAALSLRLVNAEPVWGLVQGVFPNVATDGQPIAFDVQINTVGNASGVIRSGRDILAMISGTGFEPIITWRGDCAGPTTP